MLSYKEVPIRLYADFSKKLYRSRTTGMTLKILKDKSYQPRILYPPKSSFRDEGGKKLSQTKVERVHHHYTCLTRNVESSSSICNKRAKVHKSLSKVINRIRKLQPYQNRF